MLPLINGLSIGEVLQTVLYSVLSCKMMVTANRYLRGRRGALQSSHHSVQNIRSQRGAILE